MADALDDYDDPATYATEVLGSHTFPSRYVAIVLGPSGHVFTFCGHLHRTRTVAEHCAKGLPERYVEWRRTVHHNAAVARDAEAGHAR
jgi:hypothetical protein